MIKHNISSVAIWAGISHQPLDQWLKYTDNLENAKSKSPFVKDLGWYPDIDLFYLHISENDDIVLIEELLKGAGTSSIKTDEKIAKKAREMGVTEGNRLYYYYICSEFIPESSDPDKRYNDLTFIGNFEDIA